MKKIILSLFLLLLIAIGAGIYYVYTNLDKVVAVAIEQLGSEATGTHVQVDKVSIKVTEGKASIYGLTIENPAGFSTPYIFSLGEISTHVDFSKSAADKIVIDDITIRAPQIFYEINQDNKTNFSLLQNNMNSDSSSTSADSGSRHQEPKLIIRKLSFSEADIQAKLVPLNNKEYNLKLPSIQMSNLGGSDGAYASEIAQQIVNKLLGLATDEIKAHGTAEKFNQAKQKLQQQKDNLQQENKQMLEDKKKELLKKLSQ